MFIIILMRNHVNVWILYFPPSFRIMIPNKKKMKNAVQNK